MRKILKFIYIFVILVTVLLTMLFETQSNKIKILFPTQLLKPAPTFVSATDTNTVFEYYLLENLAIGLLRDDLSEPDGFTPMLAKSWFKKNNSWFFVIREDLKWSDGSFITLIQVYEHFKKLAKLETRHLKYIQKVAEIKKNEEKNTIEFIFKSEPPDNFLDELALSDAVITRNDQEDNNSWKKVSGPYFIKRFSDGKLFLQKNKYFDLYKDYPEEVELSVPENLDDINKKVTYDLTKESAMPFTKAWINMSERFDKILSGSYSSVYFFSFKSDAWTEESRRGFSLKIQKVFRNLNLPSAFKLDNQIVPIGLPERVISLPVVNEVEFDRQITLLVPSAIESIPGFKSGIYKVFGENVKVISDPVLKSDAELLIFRANHKESIGNWSFLLTGPLKIFSKELNPLLEKAVNASRKEERILALKDLNYNVLEKNYLAPVMWSRPRYFYSDRFSLKKWNKFDLRLRIYLIEGT